MRRLYSIKNFDPAFAVEKMTSFQRYMFAMEIYNNFILFFIFKKYSVYENGHSLYFKVRCLNERNWNNKTQVITINSNHTLIIHFPF